MILSFIHIVIALTLSILLFLLITVLGNRSMYSKRKQTPFECGFDPKESARLPFSIRFFLLAIVFLIFDIEVALLFPIIIAMKISIRLYAIIARFIFLVILILGLIHEWNQGSLRWVL